MPRCLSWWVVSTLELIWQHGTPYGSRSKASGDDGIASARAPRSTRRLSVARRLTVAELIALDPHATLGSTRAQASHSAIWRAAPSPTGSSTRSCEGGSSWFAFWGVTLDDSLQAELDAIVAAAPPAAGEIDEL